jgi:hypothetical protein
VSVVIHFRNAVRKKFLLEDTIGGKSFGPVEEEELGVRETV